MVLIFFHHFTYTPMHFSWYFRFTCRTKFIFQSKIQSNTSLFLTPIFLYIPFEVFIISKIFFVSEIIISCFRSIDVLSDTLYYIEPPDRKYHEPGQLIFHEEVKENAFLFQYVNILYAVLHFLRVPNIVLQYCDYCKYKAKNPFDYITEFEDNTCTIVFQIWLL